MANKKKILLVEDELLIALDEKNTIENYGFSVDIVNNGYDAIDKIKQKNNYDLILMDVDLNDELNGPETAKYILKICDLPIVFLTNHAEKEMVEKVRKITRYGYILKSGGEFYLIQSINMAFELYEAQKELKISEKRYRELFNNTGSGVIIYRYIEGKFTIIDLNKESQHMQCITKEEAIGQSLEAVFPNISKTGLKKKMLDVFHSGYPQRVNNIYYEDEYRKGWRNYYIYQLPSMEIVCVCNDITEKHKAEAALKESENRFKSIFEKITHIPVQGYDENRKVIYWNPASETTYGYTKEEAIGQKLEDLIIPDQMKAEIIKGIDNWIKGSLKPVSRERLVLKAKDGSDVYVLSNHVMITNYYGKKELFCIDIDLSKELEYRNELQQKEQNYQRLYQLVRSMCDNLPDMIWAKDMENRYLFANKATCKKLLNAKDTNEPLGKNDQYFAERERRSHPGIKHYHDFGEICLNSDDIVKETKKAQRFDEYGNVKRKFLFLDVYKAPFYDTAGNLIGTVGCGRDMTEEQFLKEKFSALDKIINSLDEAVMVVDQSNHIQYVNNQLLAFTQEYTEEMIIGMSLSDIIPGKEIAKFEQVKVKLWEKPIVRERITFLGQRPLRTDFLMFFNQEKTSPGYIWIISNDPKTDSQKDINLLENQLREKDTLLLDIHHRVKNDFSMLHSLFSLQNASVQNNDIKKILTEMQNRVMIMKNIYEKIYLSKTFDTLSLQEFIDDIVAYFQTCCGANTKVEIETTIDNDKLSIKKMFYIGIIINEFLNNSYKYAFPDNSEGNITITIKRENRFIEILYKDNGIGLTDNIVKKKNLGFGLNLVDIFVNQLDGSFSLASENGAQMKVMLKV